MRLRAEERTAAGEAHGGQRLLGALTRAKATNVAVMVSRVYGGQNIGKARFEHIVERAVNEGQGVLGLQDVLFDEVEPALLLGLQPPPDGQPVVIDGQMLRSCRLT